MQSERVLKNRSDAKYAARQSRNRTQKALTAEYAEYAEEEPLCHFAFRVFRGFYHRGNCSQAANNLDYCSAERQAAVSWLLLDL